MKITGRLLCFSAKLLALVISLPYCGVRAETKPHQSELEIIPFAEGRAQRDGDELTLRASNGVTQVFRDEKQCGNDGGLVDLAHCSAHTLVAYFRDQHAFVVRNLYFEGGDYTWFSAENGNSVHIEGQPNYSPNNQMFAVVRGTEAGFNGIQIWRVVDQNPTLEWQYQPANYALYQIRWWENDSTIDLEVSTYVDGVIKPNVPAKLVYAAPGLPGWHLEGPVEASR